MIRAKKTSTTSRKAELSQKIDNQVSWKIVQATSNDNPLPIVFWLKRMIPWSILIGILLAYLLLN